MAKIEGLRVQNYGVLRDVRMGRLLGDNQAQALTPLAVVIGKNGSGKSTLFDAFGFLGDCLEHGVEVACDLRGRGGFARLRTVGAGGPIRFELTYRESDRARPITYELAVGLGPDGRPHVEMERLRQRRRGQPYGRPFSFLHLSAGLGEVWAGDAVEGAEEASDKAPVRLVDPQQLGIVTLGALLEHPRITKFVQFVRGWHLSYFSPDAARELPVAGPQRHLNVRGDNLGNVLQWLHREHGARFQHILRGMGRRIPGVAGIEPVETEDGRLILRFRESGLPQPILGQRMSDGTLKFLAYLLLLEDPSPPPFIGIEEPENGLHHKLLPGLAAEFRARAAGRAGSPQILVTTHQPYFVDALDPEETWILEKSADGTSTIRRAADDRVVVAMVREGQPLGSLWYSDFFDRFDDDAL